MLIVKLWTYTFSKANAYSTKNVSFTILRIMTKTGLVLKP